MIEQEAGIPVDKRLVGKEVIVQKVGAVFEPIACTVIEQISGSGKYMLLTGTKPTHTNYGWQSVHLFKILEVL